MPHGITNMNEHQARVSIVTPTFNSAQYLETTVQSVLEQTFPDWELVLLDDGSSDGTVELSRRLAAADRRITQVDGRHQGVAAARNDGLRASSGSSEFVIFLDSDDTWVPDALATLVAALEEHPQSPAAYGLARATDLDGNVLNGDDLERSMRERQEWRAGHLADVPPASPTSFASMIVSNWICTPGTCLIRRSALRSVGVFDAHTSPADDWDMNVRLSRLGDFAFVDQVVLNWRRHPSSLANTSKRWRRADFEVRVRAIRAPENTGEQRAVALELLARDCRRARAGIITAARARALRTLAGEVVYAALTHVHYAQLRRLQRRANSPH